MQTGLPVLPSGSELRPQSTLHMRQYRRTEFVHFSVIESALGRAETQAQRQALLALSHLSAFVQVEHGHVIQVFGLPNMRTVLHCLAPRDWTEPGFMGLGMIYTAMPVTNAVPASILQTHSQVDLFLDKPAASRL